MEPTRPSASFRIGVMALVIAVLLFFSLAVLMSDMDMGQALLTCCAIAVAISTILRPSVSLLRSVHAADAQDTGHSRHSLRLPDSLKPPDRVSLRSLLM